MSSDSTFRFALWRSFLEIFLSFRSFHPFKSLNKCSCFLVQSQAFIPRGDSNTVIREELSFFLPKQSFFSPSSQGMKLFYLIFYIYLILCKINRLRIASAPNALKQYGMFQCISVLYNKPCDKMSVKLVWKGVWGCVQLMRCELRERSHPGIMSCSFKPLAGSPDSQP